MVLDPDYLKTLLDGFRSAPGPTTDIRELQQRGLDYDDPKFEFHLQHLAERHYVERDDGRGGIGLKKGADGFCQWSVIPLRLTAAGHEFAETHRPPRGTANRKVEGNHMAVTRDFSKREGYRAKPAEMIREDSPAALRSFVLRQVSDRASSDIHRARTVVTNALRYIPDPSNRSVSEIWHEMQKAVLNCPWFFIYDLIEELYRDLWWSKDAQEAFANNVNELFDEENIGWQFKIAPTEFGGAPQIVVRGDEAFEKTVEDAGLALNANNQTAARTELREAIHDLSRRPAPDLTGAIHHAIAALECVAKEICREPGETLGQIAKKHPDRFPSPLGDAVSKLYGFASDRGRHVTEGKMPRQQEAQLVVSISAALTAFLLD